MPYEQPELPDWVIDLQNDLETANGVIARYHELLGAKDGDSGLEMLTTLIVTRRRLLKENQVMHDTIHWHKETLRFIRAKVDAALTPTFVAVHALEKLKEIGAKLYEEGF